MIYIIFGAPREGKTYYATKTIIADLKSGKRKVFTNYPIVLKQVPSFIGKLLGKKEKVLSSLKWDPKYAFDGITDSVIVIDEAYMDYSSREYRTFTKEVHQFFATNGHDDNHIYLIAQHYNRVDLIVREMANYLIRVNKYSFPLTDIVLMFRALWYVGEEGIKEKKVNHTDLFFPSKEVKRAYDTRYFKHESKDRDYETWESVYNVH